jgi:hypothetical protein
MTDRHLEIPVSEFERLHDELHQAQEEIARLVALIRVHVAANHDQHGALARGVNQKP